LKSIGRYLVHQINKTFAQLQTSEEFLLEGTKIIDYLWNLYIFFIGDSILNNKILILI